jgi:prophage antirepressor
MDLQVFKNTEFGQIQILEKNREPYFIGTEIAKTLGYTNPQKAVRDHVDEEDKLTERIVLSGQGRQVTLINESGLYSLILSSKLPNAKQFKRWVTSEVLPSIRKYGSFNMAIPRTLPDALNAYAREIEAHQKTQALLEAQRPKVLFADSVAASHTSILVGELAKILHQNGIKDMGQNRLFTWMRNNGYLISRKGTDYNSPTQKAMELGLFQIKETIVSHADGHTSISKTTKVTGKGQQYFINKLLQG